MTSFKSFIPTKTVTMWPDALVPLAEKAVDARMEHGDCYGFFLEQIIGSNVNDQETLITRLSTRYIVEIHNDNMLVVRKFGTELPSKIWVA